MVDGWLDELERTPTFYFDSITAISPNVEVTFEHAAPRTFDVVIGADGLHSNVRRLVFGEDAGRTQFLGGYLAVLSVPKTLAREGEMIVHLGAVVSRESTPRNPWTTRGRCSCSAARKNSSITTEMWCGRRNYFVQRSPEGMQWWTAGSTS